MFKTFFFFTWLIQDDELKIEVLFSLTRRDYNVSVKLLGIWTMFDFPTIVHLVCHQTTQHIDQTVLNMKLLIMQQRISLTMFKERKHLAKGDKKVLRICQLELTLEDNYYNKRFRQQSTMVSFCIFTTRCHIMLHTTPSISSLTINTLSSSS